MRDIKFYIILALLLALVISILTRPTKEITDLEPYRVQAAIADRQIDSLKGGNKKLARKMAEDSIIQAEEKQAYQKSITGLQTRLRSKRDRIDTLILESPALREYVATADSVISIQSSRIDSLEIDKAELRVDVKTITENFLRQIEQHESKLKSTQALADAYKKENRKERRKRKIATALIPVAAVGMFLLGAGL